MTAAFQLLLSDIRSIFSKYSGVLIFTLRKKAQDLSTIRTSHSNVFLHPLFHIPGPRLLAASRPPFIYALIKGTIVQDFQYLHERYGPAIRVAPNEVAYAYPDPYADILQARNVQNKGQFLKDRTGYASMPGHPNSILNAISPENYAQIRRVLALGLTKSVNQLVSRLQDLIVESGSKNVDMTPWFNYRASEILGHLGLGEPFDCLADARYHGWVDMLFDNAKAGGLIIATRRTNDHFQQIVNERPDIMTCIIDKKHSVKLKLDSDELNATFMVLVLVGKSLHRLEKEIRGAFGSDEDITLDAVLNEGLRQCQPIPIIFPGASQKELHSATSDPSSSFFNDQRHAIQPFAIGPRVCLGQRLAWAERQLIPAKLVWMYDFSAFEGQSVNWEDLRTNLIVEPKPINVRISVQKAA
ncbi:cytochrome P450 [Aspergillus oleicola]